MRLIGAVLFEQNDEWQTSSRHMLVEAFAQIDKEKIDPILSRMSGADGNSHDPPRVGDGRRCAPGQWRSSDTVELARSISRARMTGAMPPPSRNTAR